MGAGVCVGWESALARSADEGLTRMCPGPGDGRGASDRRRTREENIIVAALGGVRRFAAVRRGARV